MPSIYVPKDVFDRINDLPEPNSKPIWKKVKALLEVWNNKT